MQEIAKGASKQAVGVAEGVTNMNNLSQAINTVDGNVNNVSEVLNDAKMLKEEAIDSVKLLNEKTMKTSSVSNKIVKDINMLNSSMKQIMGIVKIIVSISEQTNML